MVFIQKKKFCYEAVGNYSFNELLVCFCSASALKRHPVITTFGTQKKGLTAYVLSQQQMIKQHYPVKGNHLLIFEQLLILIQIFFHS